MWWSGAERLLLLVSSMKRGNNCYNMESLKFWAEPLLSWTNTSQAVYVSVQIRMCYTSFSVPVCSCATFACRCFSVHMCALTVYVCMCKNIYSLICTCVTSNALYMCTNICTCMFLSVEFSMNPVLECTQQHHDKPFPSGSVHSLWLLLLILMAVWSCIV